MIDATRHQKVFDPDKFSRRRIDIIGAGATGSKIAMEIAKLGVQNLSVWDFDTVEPHNIANQLFGNQDVGKLKVAALAERIYADTGLKIEAHNHKVDGTERFGEVVLLLTDSMASRKEIWEKALRYKPQTELVIETRMGTDQGRVYTVNPCDPTQIKRYEATLYSDTEAEVSACGTPITVGPTSSIITGLAVWALIEGFRFILEGGERPDFETIFAVRPSLTVVASAA